MSVIRHRAAPCVDPVGQSALRFTKSWRARSVDLPDGLFGKKCVQPPLQKYFASRQTQIKFRFALSRLSEGRFAIVTNVRRDAVDADGASDESA